ncbi:cell division protein FtsA [bacterium]|nr:cell division protein FtsA [bacterium]
MGYICAIDMGGFQFKTMIASLEENGLEILASTKTETTAINNGQIVDFEQAKEALHNIHEEILTLSGINGKDIDNYYMNITGSALKGYDGTNFLNIEHRDQRIKREDILEVIENTKPEGLFEDSEIIDRIPRYFSIDNINHIKNPKGLEARKLVVNAYIIATTRNQLNNLRNVINDSIKAKNIHFIPNSIATAAATLKSDQSEIGVILIDIGGSNTDIAGFSDDALLFTNSFPGAGNYITKELAKEFSLDMKTAERLKTIMKKLLKGNANTVPVPTIGGESIDIKISSIKKVISEKFNEIFGKVYNKIQYYVEQEDFSSGIVLTGGGAKTYDLLNIAAPHFTLPIQIFNINNLKIPGLENIELSNQDTTTIGLLLEGQARQNRSSFKRGNKNNGSHFNLIEVIKNLLKE